MPALKAKTQPAKKAPVILNDGKGVKPVVQVNIKIRPANVTDCNAVLVLLARYFEELKLAYPPMDPWDALEWGTGVIRKGGCVVAEVDSQLVGSIGLEIGGFPWATKYRYLNSCWFYVAPERRKGSVATRLVTAAKDIAIANNMALRIDNVFGIEPELQDRYREMLGFQYVGGNHVWFPPAPAPKE